MTGLLSRRALAQATVGAAAPALLTIPPPRASILVRQDWQHNDEVSCFDGMTPFTTLYYDRTAADAACQRLNDEFFTVEYPTPADFEPDWDAYSLGLAPDFDATTVTWEELRRRGFPHPFSVQELTVPGENADV